MKHAEQFLLLLGALLIMPGCEPDRKYSTTEGTVTIACDESVEPVVRLLAEDFHRSYERGTILLRTVEAREAVGEFALDSIRRIVTARAFNSEERAALANVKMDLAEYKVALDAIAVIAHPGNPLKQLRLGMLDSIFTGKMTRWPGRSGGAIVVAAGDVNSSTNEVFRDAALKGNPILPEATLFRSSRQLVDFVRTTPNAIGIVGLAWLKGYDREVRVFALGGPDFRPDSTLPAGQYYSPVQAHVYRGFYPLTRPVFLYSREVIRDVGYGFISYATSATGQKLFLENGLVPVTMPVRLVEITSKEIK
jgi:phosphate transport system substrate-binding protein